MTSLGSRYPRAARFLVMVSLGALSTSCARKPAPDAARSKGDGSPSELADRQGSTVNAPATHVGKPAGFLKGQLHMHTGNSGDSDTSPDVAVRWYASHGFDFVVTTDHNVVTRTEGQSGMLVLPGVELTQNLRTCDPPPPLGMACLLHVNALFVRSDASRVVWPVPPPTARVDLYQRAVDKANDLGGIAMLNHPNFQYAADVDLVVALASKGLTMIEIENEAVDSNNDGDATHPSTEAMWDAALTRGARLFGTATDDAHHYDDANEARARGETAYVGDRGFVMVRSEKTPEGIRAAIARGDFYGSTGLMLEEMKIEAPSIHVASKASVAIEVIGAGGAVLAESHTGAIDFDVAKAPHGYIRVRAHDASRHVAFTEPMFLP